jgi:hypothetical protein
MKSPAPKSSPKAKLPAPALIAVKVLKISGDPFPSAASVTPETVSERPSMKLILDRFGQKKSPAVVPSKTNRNRSWII